MTSVSGDWREYEWREGEWREGECREYNSTSFIIISTCHWYTQRYVFYAFKEEKSTEKTFCVQENCGDVEEYSSQYSLNTSLF